jgi:hypothetical protein
MNEIIIQEGKTSQENICSICINYKMIFRTITDNEFRLEGEEFGFCKKQKIYIDYDDYCNLFEQSKE